MDVISLHLPHGDNSLPYSMGFDIKTTQLRIKQHAREHTSRCHYYDVDFVLFHNVTCYGNALLSLIHVSTTHLLNTTCSLVAIGMILGKLECTALGWGLEERHFWD